MLPDLPFGPPEASCAGLVDGVAFDASGQRLFATEFCDGTLTIIAADLSSPLPVPVPPDRFVALELVMITSPVGADFIGQARAPGALRVRPVDADGRVRRPDLFFLVGLEEGMLCAADSAAL